MGATFSRTDSPRKSAIQGDPDGCTNGNYEPAFLPAAPLENIQHEKNMNPSTRFVSLLLLLSVTPATLAGVQAQKPRITVQADQVLHPVSRYLTGACIEDVNHEIYGGLYSQMIFGESFEEAAMPLPADTPAFAGLSGAVSCRAPRREIAGSAVRSWQPFRTGSAEGVFAVETVAPFNGRQNQRMTFTGGTGAVGIENRGLNRQGMCFQAGKPYEGYVWVRRDPATGAAPVALQVALENADGSKLYARTELAVAPQDWQRLDFVLTSDAADSTGRFSITLTRPGTVVLGHAFLQPGAWGRFKGLPVRRDVVEGMLRQGLTALRYGGSMVNGADEYRWKKMLGPRDRRPPYRGMWYEYSSNGWGILDFIDLCEAAGFACVPCFNTGESAQDMADFAEYVNGPADSEWGRKRAEAGHPEPYRLKYLQLGNEQHVDGAYYEAFTRLAGAIWKRDPGITLIVGVYWKPDESIDQHAEHYRRVIEFARDRNQTVWFDVHVWNDKPHEPDLTAFDRFVRRLAGFGMDNYRICVLEENAGNHSMKRALGHARALNLFQRSKLGIPILCAANGLQPDGQNDNGWDQGLLFLNPSQVWLQPPGYVTQMVSRNYQPLCVSARVDGPESPLDVTATRSEDGGTLVLQVLNASGDPVPARIFIAGFTPAEPTAEAVQLVGRPDETNTAEAPARIVPETKPDALRLRDGNANYTFPGGSFTILRFRGGAGSSQPSASAGDFPAKSAECLPLPAKEPNWVLVWEDDFTRDGFLDTSKWVRCERGKSDWARHMTIDDAGFEVKGGSLILKGISNTNPADPVKVLTGGITTKGKFDFTYGKVEIRAQLGCIKGAWPAFWMLPSSSKPGPYAHNGEIDIMEHLNFDDFVYQTIHSHYTLGLGEKTNPKYSATARHNPGEFNIYGLEWYPDTLVFTINRKATFTYPRIKTAKEGQWPFDKPFYLLVDMQLGGNWVGAIDYSQLPVQMEIDSVRIYQDL